MDFPLYKEKYTSSPLFSCADFMQYVQKGRVNTELPIPEAVVLFYQNSIMAYAQSQFKMLKARILPGQLLLPDFYKGKLGLMHIPGYGAPAAAIFLEELIAAGIKKFISFGTAGSLQQDLNPGDIVLCDKALRDEGTSYHYLPAARYSYPGTGILKAIEEELTAKGLVFRKGACWTTDAPFMETRAEVEKYQNEGILTVDMEAAALFAVAEYRNAALGSFFIISDKLANSRWEPAFFAKKVATALNTALEIALSVLHSY